MLRKKPLRIPMFLSPELERDLMHRIPTQKHQEAAVAGQRDSDRFGPANRRRLSAPGLRTFLQIADQWSLTENERLLILGSPYRLTYGRWCKQVMLQKQITLSVDVLMRISAVLGIHQALQILYSDRHYAVEWLRTPHGATVFGDHPPLDLVTCGTQDGLLTVRRFLDSACEGRYMPPCMIDVGFFAYDDIDIIIGSSEK